MALEIVTLEDAKGFCRVDHDEEDWLFELLIGAASDAVVGIADGWVPVVGEAAPDRIRLAVLAHVASAYDNREAGVDTPAAALRLVTPLRRLSI